MRAPAGKRERALEHLLGLERRRALGRQAREAIPQLPRREVHQRVGEQRRDVGLVGMRAIDGTHRVGVVGVPRDEVGRRVVGLVAARERLDERPLDRRGAVRARARRRDLVARLLERRREVDRVERLPLLVVVRPDRVGDPPVGEREARVVLDRALEAPDRLLVVERVGPHEPAVEPQPGRSSRPSTSHACSYRDRNRVPSLLLVAGAAKIAHARTAARVQVAIRNRAYARKRGGQRSRSPSPHHGRARPRGRHRRAGHGGGLRGPDRAGGSGRRPWLPRPRPDPGVGGLDRRPALGRGHLHAAARRSSPSWPS